MSRAVPRPVRGLAAAALAVGLVAAPLMAYADSTPSPSPTPKSTAAGGAATAPGEPSSPRQTPFAGPTPSVDPTAPADPTSSDPSRPAPTDTETTGEASNRPTASTSPTTSGESPAASADASTEAPAGGDGIQQPVPEAADEPVRAQAEDQVEAQAEPAAITLTKSASPNRVSEVGQVITYRFVATNTGGVPLRDVEVDDDLEGLSAVVCGPDADLESRGDQLTCSATLTITQADLDFGTFDNFASVFAEYGEEGLVDYVGANAAATVTVEQDPSIAVRASVSPTGTADAGDRLRYTATATNTGNVTLRGARITSSLDALDLECDPSARATLAPGQSMTCDGSYRVTTGDGRRGRVSNEVTASATGPYSDQGVVDDVTLRTKVTKITSRSDTDSGLADTGGPGGALPVGAAGVVALLAGAGLLRRSRRA